MTVQTAAASAFWQRFFRRGWLLLLVAAAATHFIAGQFTSVPVDRILYLTRMLLYLLSYLATAALLMKLRRIIFAQLFVLLALLSATEVVFYFLNGMPLSERKTFVVPPTEPGHISRYLGYVNWADTVLHEVKVLDGDTLYDIHASIDHWYRRITPGHDTSRRSYALFFGCSVCFGTGCDDDGSLAYAYQSAAGDCNAYNYGTGGWGTNHLLARFEFSDLKADVPEADGMAVYVFMWSHIRRSIGDLRTHTGWGYTSPYYELRDGRPERLGNFHDDRPLTSWLYEHTYDLNTLRYFNIEWPLWMSEDDLELTASLVERSKELYRQQFGNDRFYVLIYPDWKNYFDAGTCEHFLALLKAKGIIYFDHTGIVPMDDVHQIGLDGHPRPITHRVLAQALINDLQALDTLR